MKRVTPDFQFKQFLIKQEKAGMKVGTDGVILGSVFECQEETARILDVGTGTGLLALMAAQRFPKAKIIAIEPHYESFIEAKENIENSKFTSSIDIFLSDFQNFKAKEPFDKILINPPFYYGDFGENEGRDYARNIKHFPIVDFVIFLNQFLNHTGSATFITPVTIFEEFSKELIKEEYQLKKQLDIKPIAEKPVHRILHTWSKTAKDHVQANLIIEKERHLYTPEFRRLINDFYL